MNRLSRRPLAPLAVVVGMLLCGCSDSTAPGEPGDLSLDVIWPTAGAVLEDSVTLAVATVSNDADLSGITFEASVDGSRGIVGTRTGRFVSFPVTFLEDGAHELTVRASTGEQAVRSFSRQFAPRPRVDRLEVGPAPGYADQQLTVYGSRFPASSNPADVRVRLNGESLPVYLVWTDSIYVTLPAGKESGLVTVEVDGRVSHDRAYLDLGTRSEAPRLWGVFPRNVPTASHPITLIGRNFGSGATPYFGDATGATLIRHEGISGIEDASEMVVLAPADARSGSLELYVRSGNAESNRISVVLP